MEAWRDAKRDWHDGRRHLGGSERQRRGFTLAKLKKQVDSEGPVFDWAIGWLAREDKIAIVRSKRSYVVRLKEAHAPAAGAA